MSGDIIGDIYGQADKPEALLRKPGYCNAAGVGRHPSGGPSWQATSWIPVLHRGAPSSLESMSHFTADAAHNNSKGTGAIMRVTPV
ncbi:MAG: hypothetical protein ABUS49_07125, partial [Acidobacteriota bacterium]